MSKVVYLVEQPFDARNYDRFGIEDWIERHWDVEVWDLTPLAYPRVWRTYCESGGRSKAFDGYRPITLKSQLSFRHLAREKAEYFIDLTGDHYWSAKAKLSLMRNGATRVICNLGAMPEPGDEAKSSFLGRVAKVFEDGPARFITRLVGKLSALFVAHFVRPGLVVVSGKMAVNSAINAGYEGNIIHGHNMDYDLYRRFDKSIDTSSGGYAIFLDQDLCFHPEFIHSNVSPYATPVKYFPTMCKGLRGIANSLGVDVIVAAHPRSSYGQRSVDYFEGIPVESARTAEMIRSCKVVVCHCSTAIQLAVLFGKPIIFVTTEELMSSELDAHIAGYASALGKVVINLDGDLESVDWQKQASVDDAIYSKYVQDYIKCDGSLEMPLWNIVINHVEMMASRPPDMLPRRCLSAGGGK